MLVGISNSMGMLQWETALEVVRRWMAMEFREESRELQDVFWIRDLLSLRRSNYVKETAVLFYCFGHGCRSLTSRTLGRSLRLHSEMCSVLALKHNF